MRKILTFVGCETLNILQQSIYETTTDPKALKDVLAWFDGFHALPIPQGDWLQCQLALIEGFTNAVRHAHKDLPHATPIAIAVTVTNLISLGGRSNWLDGALLLATYIVLGVAFYYHPA